MGGGTGDDDAVTVGKEMRVGVGVVVGKGVWVGVCVAVPVGVAVGRGVDVGMSVTVALRVEVGVIKGVEKMVEEEDVNVGVVRDGGNTTTSTTVSAVLEGLVIGPDRKLRMSDSKIIIYKITIRMMLNSRQFNFWIRLYLSICLINRSLPVGAR